MMVPGRGLRFGAEHTGGETMLYRLTMVLERVVEADSEEEAYAEQANLELFEVVNSECEDLGYDQRDD
jgi:hypothetical protein